MTNEKDIVVKTKEGKRYYFEINSYEIEKDSIIGSGEIRSGITGIPNIPFSGGISFPNIESISVDEFNLSAAIVLGILVLGVITIIIVGNSLPGSMSTEIPHLNY